MTRVVTLLALIGTSIIVTVRRETADRQLLLALLARQGLLTTTTTTGTAATTGRIFAVVVDALAGTLQARDSVVSNRGACKLCHRLLMLAAPAALQHVFRYPLGEVLVLAGEVKITRPLGLVLLQITALVLVLLVLFRVTTHVLTIVRRRCSRRRRRRHADSSRRRASGVGSFGFLSRRRAGTSVRVSS